MKKLFLWLMAAVLLMAGCASPDTEQLDSLSDDTGVPVVVEKPQRVVIMTGSLADLWSLCAPIDTIVGTATDAWTTFDLQLSSSTADLGGVKQMSPEAIAALNPDLVIGSSKNDSQNEMRPVLESMDIETAYFDVSDFDDYLNVLKIFSQINNNPDAYTKYGEDQKKQINDLLKTVPEKGPKVLYIRAAGDKLSVKGSENSVLGEMLEQLHADNIAGNEESSPLSMEEILKQDPEMIFLVVQSKKAEPVVKSQIDDNEAFQSLSAVKNGKLYVMDNRLYNVKPNQYWYKAMKDLYDILYPQN